MFAWADSRRSAGPLALLNLGKIKSHQIQVRGCRTAARSSPMARRMRCAHDLSPTRRRPQASQASRRSRSRATAYPRTTRPSCFLTTRCACVPSLLRKGARSPALAARAAGAPATTPPPPRPRLWRMPPPPTAPREPRARRGHVHDARLAAAPRAPQGWPAAPPRLPTLSFHASFPEHRCHPCRRHTGIPSNRRACSSWCGTMTWSPSRTTCLPSRQRPSSTACPQSSPPACKVRRARRSFCRLRSPEETKARTMQHGNSRCTEARTKQHSDVHLTPWTRLNLGPNPTP